MSLSTPAPIYTCPHDYGSLALERDSAACSTCRASFEIRDGILVLDTLQRPDRVAFDPAASKVRELSPEDRASGRRRAEALLTRTRIEALREAFILDIGCGFGDLTCGLASLAKVENCEIYAVDHSLESLAVLRRSVSPQGGNRVHISAQDAGALCFPESSFDLVCGSAVLHHVLDYRSLLAAVYRILKPGGSAVFTEPFLQGYLLAAFFLSLSVNQSGLTEKDLRRPEFGLANFIIEDTRYRIQHQDDLAALDKLTDKHYFREGDLVDAGHAVGFRKVAFINYEPAEFYEPFMRHFLDVYGVSDPALSSRAEKIYRVFAQMTGKYLSREMSHFKYIVLVK